MQRFASRKIPTSCEVLRKKQFCSVIFMSTGISRGLLMPRNGLSAKLNSWNSIFTYCANWEKYSDLSSNPFLHFILSSYMKTNIYYVVWLYWLCRGTKHCPCEAILKMYMYYPLPSGRGECYLRTPNRDCRQTHENV